MVRTQIQLTEQQAQALKALAATNGVSVTELIRQGVEYILATKQMLSSSERQQRALAAAGRFHSTITNLGTAHDEYLAEVYGETN
ncbi:MAG: ribbon-helix-helix domain-containing protein [Roseiflexaceae bacterium]|nr:ribbon-helix-helix domain-containing protein [Roseiflexaceae bacterium]